MLKTNHALSHQHHAGKKTELTRGLSSAAVRSCWKRPIMQAEACLYSHRLDLLIDSRLAKSTRKPRRIGTQLQNVNKYSVGEMIVFVAVRVP